MTLTIIIILISLGLVFVLLEIFVLPGTAVLGLIGLGLMATGVWSTYDNFGIKAGHYTLIGVAFFSALSLYYALKSHTWEKLMLNAKIKGKVNTFDENMIGVGDTGITVSRLAPMGKASINDNYCEVKTVADFIDENTEITVIKVDGNNIFVKAK